jgi:hypothetical protein
VFFRRSNRCPKGEGEIRQLALEAQVPISAAANLDGAAICELSDATPHHFSAGTFGG